MEDKCEDSVTLARCAVGVTDTVEAGLHLGSAQSPFLFAVMLDTLTDGIRQPSWTMMFAVYIVTRNKGVYQGEESLGR